MEPLDVLRIAGESSTHTNIYIETHSFQDLTQDPIWLRAFYASQNLCEECKNVNILMRVEGVTYHIVGLRKMALVKVLASNSNWIKIYHMICFLIIIETSRPEGLT